MEDLTTNPWNKKKASLAKSEALKMNGGGENRTLVLSKLPTNDYMLSLFKNELILRKMPHNRPICFFLSRASSRKSEKKSPYQG